MFKPSTYQQTQVMTASPMELVIMLYDECIQSLERAEKAFEIEEATDRIQVLNNQLLRAEDIITELAVSLDKEKGGSIAENLHRLYDFMLHHLSQANTRHIVKPVQDVKKMMQEMREAWQKVAEQEPARDETNYVPTAAGGISVNG